MANEWTLERAVQTVTRQKAHKYRGIAEAEDISQELWAYVYGAGKKDLETWRLAGDWTRVMLALHGAGRQYCETEKAHKEGYKFEDIAWYSPHMLADLVPYALDPLFDGSRERDHNEVHHRRDPAEGHTLLAMIADVQKALKKTGLTHAHDFDPTSDSGMSNLVRLVDALGGSYPAAPGYHRPGVGKRSRGSGKGTRAAGGDSVRAGSRVSEVQGLGEV